MQVLSDNQIELPHASAVQISKLRECFHTVKEAMKQKKLIIEMKDVEHRY